MKKLEIFTTDGIAFFSLWFIMTTCVHAQYVQNNGLFLKKAQNQRKKKTFTLSLDLEYLITS